MSASKGNIELSPRRVAALAAAVVALLVAAVAVTVFVEHRRHGHAQEAGHDEHHGHEHGKEEGAHGHGEGKGHAHGEHAHDEHAHDEHAHDEGDEAHAGGGDRVKLSPAMIQNAGLEMLTAGPGNVAVTVTLPGEVALNAEAIAHVTPRVPGTAREVKKQLGDTVKRGEVLAVLDSRELAELERELLAAKERLALAEASFTRQEALWKEQISAEKEYLAAKQAVAEARIEQRSAAQKLSAAAGSGVAKGSGYALVAPMDGTIIEKHIAIGEVLKEDTQVFVIADLSTIWVNVTVYARDLSRVRVGQTAWVKAEGIEQPAQGTLAYLGQVVDEQNRSAVARVVLQNPGAAWRPGLFATADVAIEEAAAPVVVSDEALQRVEGKDVVFVEEGGSFEARPVKIGRRGMSGPEGQGRQAGAPDAEPRRGAAVVEIEAGVAAGERYAGKNSFILKAELGKSEAGHQH
ncbi:cytochrome C peroxidase [Sorangium cellulosum]|uniref:Cytochrome C peroxidase n=1 Tax=Sorangium cellulosum TaxID=56 RepID=A0A2L0EXZ9_SORCE|nr:efflux RND transporter periplasmic adaptor subunit [Sorangium cellulosum]AUX44178.1 cytochrome C peroxidase [Sorangium cellulosum]